MERTLHPLLKHCTDAPSCSAIIQQLITLSTEGHAQVHYRDLGLTENDPLIAHVLKSLGNFILFDSPYFRWKIFDTLKKNILKMAQEKWQKKIKKSVFPTIDQLNSDQQKAVKKIDCAPLCCLIGGPGTGKSYTAIQYIRAAMHAGAIKRPYLAAPTGKAAANLLNGVQNCGLQEKVWVGTVHKLLEIHHNRGVAKRNAMRPIPSDFILIDETSMLDLRRLYELLLASQSAQLVLMGDPHQLPAIDSAGGFSTLIDAAPGEYCAQLHICQRTEQPALLRIAETIRYAPRAQVAKTLENCFATEESLDAMLHKIPEKDLIFSKPEEAIAALKKRLILSPLRRTQAGSENINGKILERLTPNPGSFIPIMLTANSYRWSLSNGQIGAIEWQTAHWQKNMWVWFYIDGELVRLPKALVPPCTLGWCSSIHKAQGSESAAVWLYLPQQPLSRSALYTAVTRARKSLQLFGYKEALQLIE